MGEDIFIQQAHLQNQALEVLQQLDLERVFSEVGKPILVGSAALGLMTWKDIDFSVIITNFNEDSYFKLLKDLFQQKGVIELTLQDTRSNTYPDLTSGLYIGIKYTVEDIKEPWDRIKNKSASWKIDIWLLTQDNDIAIKKTEWIRNNLDEEKRRAILTIKNVVAQKPEYRKSITSTDIYTAVISKGVRDIEGFNDYVNKSGRFRNDMELR